MVMGKDDDVPRFEIPVHAGALNPQHVLQCVAAMRAFESCLAGGLASSVYNLVFNRKRFHQIDFSNLFRTANVETSAMD